MTYKSIDIIITQRIEAGELVRFVPEFDPGESELREMFMSSALHSWVYQSDRRKSLNFKANIRAFLGRFVKGEIVDNYDYMKSWRSNVFELRVQNQPHGERVRIFGGFAKPDTFIALYSKRRSEFDGCSDPAWDAAIDRTLDKWSDLFSGYSPVRARPFSGCVTLNYFDVYE